MTFREVLVQILHHDLGFGFYISDGAPQKMFRILAKSPGVLCGTIFVPTILEIVEKEFFLKPYSNRSEYPVRVRPRRQDGEKISSGYIVAELYGNAEVLLKAERTLCNIISRLSGIATVTNHEVEKIRQTSVLLLDTRKDIALLRAMDKYAVRIGGGMNHRAGFYDGILIKDNDIEVYGGVRRAIDVRIKESKFLTRIEIEVDSIEKLREVLTDGRTDAILLDNMPPSLLKEAVMIIKGGAKPYRIEASGVSGFDLREVAETGINAISISSLVSRGEGNPLDISMKAIQ